VWMKAASSERLTLKYLALILLSRVSMGGVKVRGVVANPLKHELRVEVEFIAATGAVYSVNTLGTYDILNAFSL